MQTKRPETPLRPPLILMEASAETYREYYEDSYRFESSAKIVSLGEKDSKQFIVLDKTIFHPQGGG